MHEFSLAVEEKIEIRSYARASWGAACCAPTCTLARRRVGQRFYVADAFGDLFDNADAFMTENSSFLHTRHDATHEMQIAAADRAGCQTHNGVEIVL